MGGDAFDDRHDSDRQPKPDTGQQPGTPDPRPGTGGTDAADQRH